MCKHSWVDTGLNYTFCRYCQIQGDLVQGEVLLRKPSKPFPLDLLHIGLPIRYQNARRKIHYGSPQLVVYTAWIDKDLNGIGAGEYYQLTIECSLMNPDAVLILPEDTGNWTVVNADTSRLLAFLDSFQSP